MHTVVEIIPLLLHASLFFFFGGLVAFLIPVNTIMTLIAAALLAIVTAVYTTFTLLPLWYLDCPYRTPLSVSFWQLLQMFKRIWPCRSTAVWWPLYSIRRRSSDSETGDAATVKEEGGSHPSRDATNKSDSCDESGLSKEKTMVEAIFHAAMDPHERRQRHRLALAWTMKSLTDGAELEPFVEALPDLLWGPDGPRHTYKEHILHLIHNPKTQLHNRIAALLESCYTAILPADTSKHRLITCYRAFWAIASLSEPAQSSADSSFGVDFSHICWQPTFDCSKSHPEIIPYFVSALAMMLWSTVWAMRTAARKTLLTPEVEARECGFLGLAPISSFIKDLYVKVLSFSNPVPVPLGSVWMLIDNLPYLILFKYLGDSSLLAAPPYHWEQTRSLISQNLSTKYFQGIRGPLETCLKIVVKASSPGWINCWIDARIVLQLLSFWRPESPPFILDVTICFLNRVQSTVTHDFRFESEHRSVLLHLWSNFPATLVSPSATQDTFTALWCLQSLASWQSWSQKQNPEILEALVCLLDALHPESSFTNISTSIITLIRHQTLNEIMNLGWTAKELPLIPCIHRLFPDDGAIQISDQAHHISAAGGLATWVEEARFINLVEFLERCSSDSVPYNPVETVQAIDPREIKSTPIPASIQIRLAESISSIYAKGHMVLINRIINCSFWRLYTEETGPLLQHRLGWLPWLDDSTARHKIKQIFVAHIREYELGFYDNFILMRLFEILRGLDSWHPEPEPSASQSGR